mmetsp:Transcript_6518/g.13299  ORF Transcript_6518/g.13299 Transcript_6518/m.13299 type:complete len:312 (+) Transcript_6518:37-972(+)
MMKGRLWQTAVIVVAAACTDAAAAWVHPTIPSSCSSSSSTALDFQTTSTTRTTMRLGSPRAPQEKVNHRRCGPYLSSSSSSSSSRLHMGLLDGLRHKFLQSRDGDFVKLTTTTDAGVFGPGPLLILYHVPTGIVNDEIQDMLQDEAPQAWRRCQEQLLQHNNNNNFNNDNILPMARLDDTNLPQLQDSVLSLPLETALETLLASPPDTRNQQEPFRANPPATTATTTTTTPVLLFSGFSNPEMLRVYKVLSNEIYLENQAEAACAKVVPNALNKPLQQVLDEICGDHQDALRMVQQEQQEEQDDDGPTQKT